MKRGITYALRNINRNRLNAIITLVSLSLAFASVLIFYLLVTQEKSYNSSYENSENIHWLNYKLVGKDGIKGADHLVKPELARV